MSTPEFPSSGLPPPDESRSDLVARFVDGQLSDAERAEFEARLIRDPQLHREVTAQRDADASLRTLFDPARAAHLSLDDAPLAGRLGAPAPWWRTTRGLAGMAAALVLLGLTWLIVEPFVLPNALAAAYAREQRENFAPQVVCTTPEEFEGWTRAALGQPMVALNVPADVQLVGWDYAPEVARYTCVLIAKVGDRHVLVMMDRADQARPVSRRLLGDLHVFEGTLGNVRLTEVSPLDQPRLLPLLADPTAHQPKSPG